MKKLELICFLVFLISLFATSTFAQRAKSALLPSSEVKMLANQCSRPSPSKYTDTWQPSKADIEKMESKFDDIKKLVVKECCIQGATIENPEKYYMQYVGIVLEGKILIYISAFSRTQPTEFSGEVVNGTLSFKEVPSDMWKTHAIVICDGGNAWGVPYDPSTGKFAGLAINGIA